MDLKTKMKIRTAVADYQKLFPRDYELLIATINQQRENLANEMAEIKGTHAIQRGLFTISEKLSGMIAMKLTQEEALSFSQKDNARWFAKEFPQFAITKEI